MAKFKMKKLPKKPKASASVATLENYLKKVGEIRAFNATVAREKARHEGLKKRVSAISGADVQPGKGRVSAGGPRKHKSSGKKSPAKKKAASRKRKR